MPKKPILYGRFQAICKRIITILKFYFALQKDFVTSEQ